MKTYAISFSEFKQIRKQYIMLIAHDKSLVTIDNSHGAIKVLDELEKRYKRYSVSNEDVKALKYIIDNYENLKFRITWY